jgi:signal transduction histidine kinase
VLERVHVEDVLRVVKKTLEPMASRAGLTLDVEPPHATLAVRADRTRLSQILMNYGSNAIKYNRPSGDVTFSAESIEDDCARIRVSDTGMGIPAEKQGKLFQPFHRAGRESSSIEGTGIGLVITKRLAELMGGAVGFRSVPRVGSEFWVDMPMYVE